MDVCCLNRPFDDLSQDRVYLEAEAVLSILSHCRNGEWTLIASGAINYELSNASNTDKMKQVQTLYAIAGEWVKSSAQTEQRSTFFMQNGLKALDSLHLALAETNGVDVFLTTDDRLLKTLNRIDLKVKATNPVLWLWEVNNEQWR